MDLRKSECEDDGGFKSVESVFKANRRVRATLASLEGRVQHCRRYLILSRSNVKAELEEMRRRIKGVSLVWSSVYFIIINNDLSSG